MFSSALLCCLVLMAGVEVCQTHGIQPGHNNCTNFLTNLNNMLRELHEAFGKVKEFFVSMMPSYSAILPVITQMGIL